MLIRTASIEDIEKIAAVEAACFPAAEAATKEQFSKSIRYISHLPFNPCIFIYRLTINKHPGTLRRGYRCRSPQAD